MMSVSFCNPNKTNVGLQVVATLARDKSAKYTNEDWRSQGGLRYCPLSLVQSHICLLSYLELKLDTSHTLGQFWCLHNSL